ncbi:MAG: PIG-L family deacetylase [Bacteroidota bacterium]
MVRRIKNAIKRRIANFIATESAYHFLVRDWMGKADVDVMQYFFGLDFFRYQLRPVEPNLVHYKNVLLLAPHQDDESIGAGGLLQKLNQQGSNITIVYVTDGAQSNIPNTSAAQSVKIRFKEAQGALKNIQCSVEKLNISNLSPAPTVKDLNHLSDIIQDSRPDLILLPWLLDLPAKHRMVNHLLVLCNRIKPIKMCEIWGYQVHNHLYPNICIDISNEMQEKVRMIESFKSQNTTYKAYDKITKGLNAYNAKYLNSADFAEIYFGLSKDKYLSITEHTYSSNFELVYKGAENLHVVMEKLEQEVTGLLVTGR